jgi:hypothetical protein
MFRDIIGDIKKMEVKDGAIEHRLKSFLMAARAGLLAICTAIEKFIGFEKGRQNEYSPRQVNYDAGIQLPPQASASNLRSFGGLCDERGHRVWL